MELSEGLARDAKQTTILSVNGKYLSEANRQLETRIPDVISSNWSDAAERCSTQIFR
jgi:hypothetical protein